MKTSFTALRAVFYMSGFFFLWGWIAFGVRRYDEQLGIALPQWMVMPGIALMVAGGILALTCIAVFISRGEGTPAPFDPPTKFVAVGPYKYVRNPMYIGGFTVLVGLGLYLHSISILLLTLVWVFLFHMFVIFFEEPYLREKFGPEYENYCTAVRRWILKFEQPS